MNTGFPQQIASDYSDNVSHDIHPSLSTSDDSVPALSLSFKQLVIINQSCQSQTVLLININMQKKKKEKQWPLAELFQLLTVKLLIPITKKQQPSEEYH